MNIARGEGEPSLDDGPVLTAARAVFLDDADAPVSAVARRAGVGIGAVYRRFPNKEALLRRLSADGQAAYIAAAEAALDEPDARASLTTFLTEVSDADTHSLVAALAGRFAPTPEMFERGEVAVDLTERLVARAHRAGVLRSDVGGADLSLILLAVAAVRGPDADSTVRWRRRLIALMLASLSGIDGPPLPAPGPTWADLTARYDT